MGQEDADGDYWLFIQGGDLKATFRLNPGEEEDSIPRRASKSGEILIEFKPP